MRKTDCFARGCGEINLDENKINCPSDLYSKLKVYDWLKDIPGGGINPGIVEIRFKNTRKGYFVNVNQLRLEKDDIVAVEASPGHDIGMVSLTGDLVLCQLAKNNIDPAKTEFKKVYRKAKTTDLQKWHDAITLEHDTMIKARQIASDLKLDMKIGDVEYQGDKTKAIFYYIADERVDFRELIKILADEFKIRVEMRQIGARQEAGRIGGIGPCGRELCCATWITNFISVTTNAARVQDVSLNPQKLAGQCGKLKCCLNYELPSYLDALENFPDEKVNLETTSGVAFFQKQDIFRGIMWYAYEKESAAANLIPLTVEKVKKYISLNLEGKKIEALEKIFVGKVTGTEELDYQNVVGQESLTRFEDKNKKRKKGRKRKNQGKKNKKPGHKQ